MALGAGVLILYHHYLITNWIFGLTVVFSRLAVVLLLLIPATNAITWLFLRT
jgi:hypothetical protein